MFGNQDRIWDRNRVERADADRSGNSYGCIQDGIALSNIGSRGTIMRIRGPRTRREITLTQLVQCAIDVRMRRPAGAISRLPSATQVGAAFQSTNDPCFGW